jgi:hypothetical protein
MHSGIDMQGLHGRTVYQIQISDWSAAANNKRHCIDCEIYGASLAAGSYQSHLETQYDIF